MGPLRAIVKARARSTSQRKKGQRQDWEQGYYVGPRFIQEIGPETNAPTA